MCSSDLRWFPAKAEQQCVSRNLFVLVAERSDEIDVAMIPCKDLGAPLACCGPARLFRQTAEDLLIGEKPLQQDSRITMFCEGVTRAKEQRSRRAGVWLAQCGLKKALPLGLCEFDDPGIGRWAVQPRLAVLVIGKDHKRNGTTIEALDRKSTRLNSSH